MSRLINWWRHRASKGVTTAIVSLHVLSLLALHPQFFSWSGLWIFLFLYWLTAGIGITLCFHRLLTHASFKTSNWIRFILTMFACLAWQGSPISWVGTHIGHHAHSDTDKDPHTPRHGFNWAHILWLLNKNPEGFDPYRFAKSLTRDPFMRMLDRWFWLPQVILAVALYAIGYYLGGNSLAMSWIVWGIALRTVLVFHATWFVNSATHTWGYQNFKDTGDDSKNLWWVAILAFGEGWHNNHHAHPRSASHGMRWFELDPTYWTIVIMSWFGLASRIVKPPKL